MGPLEYIGSAVTLSEKIAQLSPPQIIPESVLAALCYVPQGRVSLAQWQKQAFRHWHVVGGYGIPVRGDFRYVVEVRADNFDWVQRLAKRKLSQAFSDFAAGVVSLRLLNDEDRWPVHPISAESTRAELHFFTLGSRDDAFKGREQVHLELPGQFAAFLESIGLAQPFVIRQGGYTSIKATPNDYQKIIAFNHLRTIRPAARLSLRSAPVAA
jgi:hypothetical protein